jgi:uncharacterized membrane protein YphA (DoxX/SURF4 family)
MTTQTMPTTYTEPRGGLVGEGFECHILAIALALVVMLRGSGAASVDRALSS